MKKLLGIVLLLVPFAAIFFIGSILHGPIVTGAIFGVVAIVVALIWTGISLIAD